MSTLDTRTEPAAEAVALRWLVQVRWVAVGGQLAATLAPRIFVEPPTTALLVVAAITAGTNLWVSRFGASFRRPGLPGMLLLLDTFLLTLLLFRSGGAANPFSILYLVHIALAAVVLSARWTAALAASAIVLYGVLFALGPSSGPTSGHEHNFDTHLRGMWVAFVLAAGLVSFFVIRLRATIEQRERDLAAQHARAGRSEKLAALATLAAGAAHELATPLATIALAAGELTHEISRADSASIAADLQLIRSEVERCRTILDDMAAGAGEAPGEKPRSERAKMIIDACLQGLAPADAARVDVSIEPADAAAFIPPRAMGRCLGSLLRNAFDASGPDARIEIDARLSGSFLNIAIRDHGPGMSPDDLARAGEPFWTTKPAGQGMGLGLFLVRATLEQIGGRLDLQSAPSKGVTATLSLPVMEESA